MPQLMVNFEKQHCFGVIDGDKDSNYYTTLDRYFYNDIRFIYS